MAKFAIYEIWTRCHIIEASSMEEAYNTGLDEAHANADGQLHLSNWHVYPADDAARICFEADEHARMKIVVP